MSSGLHLIAAAASPISTPQYLVIGSDLGQGCQHKGPVEHFAMRQGQQRRLHLQIADEKQVNVNRARSPTFARDAPQFDERQPSCPTCCLTKEYSRDGSCRLT